MRLYVYISDCFVPLGWCLPRQKASSGRSDLSPSGPGCLSLDQVQTSVTPTRVGLWIISPCRSSLPLPQPGADPSGRSPSLEALRRWTAPGGDTSQIAEWSLRRRTAPGGDSSQIAGWSLRRKTAPGGDSSQIAGWSLRRRTAPGGDWVVSMEPGLGRTPVTVTRKI